jgi:hypothetical protein
MKKKNLVGIFLMLMAVLSIIVSSCKTHNKNNTVVTKTTPDSIIIEVCDTITKQWSIGTKQDNIKNINLKDSIRNDFYWDPESNKWINYQKVEYVYDDKGSETSLTYSSFDNNTNLWIFSSKSEATFNKKGNRILDTYYIWQASSSQWVASVKTEFSYNDNGNDTLETLYIWGTNYNKWIVSCKIENSYNATVNKILRVDSKFLQNAGIWEFICKYEYTYDDANNLKSEKYYYWNPISKTWFNSSKSEYEYNNKLISQSYHYLWLYSDNGWFLDNKSTYYY